MPRVSVQKESGFHLSLREIERIVYAASSFRDRCILELLWKTGIRRTDVSALDVRGVDLAKKLLHIREGSPLPHVTCETGKLTRTKSQREVALSYQR